MAIKIVPARRAVYPNPGSSRGGLIAAMRMSAEQRQDRARRGGVAVLSRYSQGYFGALGSVSRSRRENEES